jgi:hypothetical protein
MPSAPGASRAHTSRARAALGRCGAACRGPARALPSTWPVSDSAFLPFMWSVSDDPAFVMASVERSAGGQRVPCRQHG